MTLGAGVAPINHSGDEPLSPRVSLDRQKPSNTRYCSVAGVQRLRYYRYRNSDLSLLQKYFHSPTAEFVVKFMPTTLAPNTITMMGFVLVITSQILCYLWSPTITETPVPLLCAIHSLLFYVYNVFDNCDGKQARRTKSSSPLGELFDHGCDSLTCCLTNLVLCSCIGFPPTDWRILGLSLFGCIPFFFCAWEKYYTHTMNLWYINGPSEGMFVITLLMGSTFIVGPDFWSQDYRPFLGLSTDTWPKGELSTAFLLPFTPLGLIPTLLVHMYTVKKQCAKTGDSFIGALALLLPYLSLVGGHIFWFAYSPSNIMAAYPRLFFYSMMFVFSFMVVRMMLAALLKEPYWGLQGGTINYRVHVAILLAPLFAAVANVAYARFVSGSVIVPEVYILIGYFIVATVTFAHFAVNVILEITRGLDFYCFDLAKRFVASPDNDPWGDDQTTLQMLQPGGFVKKAN